MGSIKSALTLLCTDVRDHSVTVSLIPLRRLHSVSSACCLWAPVTTWLAFWAGEASAMTTLSCYRSWRSWSEPPPKCWTGKTQRHVYGKWVSGDLWRGGSEGALESCWRDSQIKRDFLYFTLLTLVKGSSQERAAVKAIKISGWKSSTKGYSFHTVSVHTVKSYFWCSGA